MRRTIVLQELKLKLPTIPENIKRLGIDIDLSYDAPHSQQWLKEQVDTGDHYYERT